MDTPWSSWLRNCATSRKAAGSIPDGVMEIFHWHNPSGHIMALGSIQPFLGGKGGRRIGITTLPSSCTEIWEPQPSGTLRSCPELYKDCFIFYRFYKVLFYPIGSLYPPARTVTIVFLRGTKKGTLHVEEACVWWIASYSKLRKRASFLR
jgi:hypothetical protein